jgi:hypothetical protein
MQLEQQMEMYQPTQFSGIQAREIVYRTVNLEDLSATALYTGAPCGGGFRPASSLNLGPGIARRMPEAGDMIERIRKDNDFPSHLNYEYLVPGVKKPLANIHIPLGDD